MSNTLYLECNSGISGDMTVAALLDLGADETVLKQVLSSIPVKGFEIKISRVKKSGLDACDFDVILDKEFNNHDHDMEYLHGRNHHKESNPGQEHSHEGTHHNHRTLADVEGIVKGTSMTENARKIALGIFTILAQAEAQVHGETMETVHFHEVGAIDSIVDIVSIAVCLDNLNITECVVPKINEGTGSIRCAHGILPVPVPAVSSIVANHGLTLSIMSDIEGEFVTPTGAAVVAAIKTADALPEKFSIEKVGMGAGKREYEKASILRAMLISSQDHKGEDVIYKLESNIDDCTGEALGYVMERLLQAGARDVHYIPVFMKKNRPAYELTVICKKEKIEELEQIIFSETTTIGIRRQKMQRSILKRKIEQVETSLGTAQVKVCQVGQAQRKYPEYDSVVSLCKSTGKSYQEVYSTIERESNESMGR